MIKRILLPALLVLIAFCGCKDDNGPVEKPLNLRATRWGGIHTRDNLTYKYTFVFLEDGTLDGTLYAGETYKITGTWIQDEDKISLNYREELFLGPWKGEGVFEENGEVINFTISHGYTDILDFNLRAIRQW